MNPAFGSPVSGWYRYFAWRPVSTLDRGWRWFSFVWKRKCQPHLFLSGPGNPWFQYRASNPKKGK